MEKNLKNIVLNSLNDKMNSNYKVGDFWFLSPAGNDRSIYGIHFRLNILTAGTIKKRMSRF
jgi:hypothetical protein